MNLMRNFIGRGALKGFSQIKIMLRSMGSFSNPKDIITI
jgi:hypothetical protein